MKALSPILLFALVTFFIMTFRIGPGDTSYVQFGLIFLAMLCYLVFERWRSWLLWLIIAISIGAAAASVIVVRHRTAPVYTVHDIILQQESAIRFLLDGVNPYSATYFATPLEEWHYSATETNPALYHFVMMPWYLLFSLPFYYFSHRLIGYYDGRIPLFFLFALILIMAWRLPKNREVKRQALILLAFNPATLGYLIEGRADFFMFAFLFMSFFLLFQKRYLLSAIPLALAFATKQSVWPIFPLYLAYLVFKQKNLVRVGQSVALFGLLFCLIVAPFFFWNPKAFSDSTIFYLTGQAENSYPIAGYGWGMVLNQLGIIGNVHAYYPFWIWQAVFCLPVLALLLRWLTARPTVNRLITSYAVFTLVFWYFSRYFNNSHLGYLSTVFLSAWIYSCSKRHSFEIR